MGQGSVNLVIRGILLLYLFLTLTTGFKDDSRCVLKEEVKGEGKTSIREGRCGRDNRRTLRRKRY